MKRSLFCLLALFAAPGVTWATGTWSSCQTITAVSNYLAYSDSVYVIFSPGVPGCSADAAGGVVFQIGQMGVTSDTIKTLLATAMFAYGADKRVMVYYDNANSACYSRILSVGGFSGQCP